MFKQTLADIRAKIEVIDKELKRQHPPYTSREKELRLLTKRSHLSAIYQLCEMYNLGITVVPCVNLPWSSMDEPGCRISLKFSETELSSFRAQHPKSLPNSQLPTHQEESQA